MQSAILVLHLMIAVVLIGLVLLQRSEGGALGIGGGGGGGGGGFGSMMSARGAASGLVRTTVFVAGAFFITSITLTVFGNSPSGSLLDAVDGGKGFPANTEIQLPLGNERSAEEAEALGTKDSTSNEPVVPLSQ